MHMQVLQGKGLRLVLDLPAACFLPEHEPYISAIARHILEDPATLQAAMEAEIRNTLANGGRPPKANPYAAGACVDWVPYAVLCVWLHPVDTDRSWHTQRS